MENKQISLFEVFKESIVKTFKHFGLLILAMGTIFLTGIATLAVCIFINKNIILGLKGLLPQMQALSVCQGDQCTALALKLGAAILALVYANLFWVALAFIIGWIVGALLNLGFARFTLSIHDTKTASLKLLFPSIGMLLKYIFAAFFYMLIIFGASLAIAALGLFIGAHIGVIGIGSALFLIPGVYFAVRLGFFNYAIIDRNAGILESLSQSWALTKGHTLFILGIIVLTMILNSLGSMIYIGFLITWPFAMFAYACAYRKLVGNHQVTVETPSTQSSYGQK